MELHARAPDPLTKSGNMARNWKKWKEDFNMYLKETGYDKKGNDVKAALFMSRIGPIGLQAIQNLSFDSVKDKDNLDILIPKLDLYFDPTKNEVVHRHNFFRRSKYPDESMEDFVAKLKELAKTCNFGHLKDSLIRDQVVLNINDVALLMKILKTGNLSLPKLMSMYNDHIIEKQGLQNTVKQNNTISKSLEKDQSQSNQAEKKMQSAVSEFKKPCWRCGQKHSLRNCIAWGHKCGKCGELHHFTNHCRPRTAKNDEDETNKYKHNNFLQKSTPSVCSKTSQIPPLMRTPVQHPIYTPSAPPTSDDPTVMIYPNLDHMNLEERQAAKSTGRSNVTLNNNFGGNPTVQRNNPHRTSTPLSPAPANVTVLQNTDTMKQENNQASDQCVVS